MYSCPVLNVATIDASPFDLSQTHAVSAIKCVSASLLFSRFVNDRSVDLAPVWHQRVVSSSMLFGVSHETCQDEQARAWAKVSSNSSPTHETYFVIIYPRC